MKKKWGIVSVIAIFLISVGILMVHYMGDFNQDTIIGTPEGYEEPEGRVEKLKIEGSVSKYYDENIDLVAFGPGSGWLKLKTRDGISPTLSFKRVTQKDVQKFNKFSKNLGLPIRVSFSGNALSLTTEMTGDDPIYVADITEEKIGANSIMNKGWYRKEGPTRLAIRKDQSGKVFLVAADSPGSTPETTPEEQDVLLAQRDKKKATQ